LCKLRRGWRLKCEDEVGVCILWGKWGGNGRKHGQLNARLRVSELGGWFGLRVHVGCNLAERKSSEGRIKRLSQKNSDASSNVWSRKSESLREAFWDGPLWDKVNIIMKRKKTDYGKKIIFARKRSIEYQWRESKAKWCIMILLSHYVIYFVVRWIFWTHFVLMARLSN